MFMQVLELLWTYHYSTSKRENVDEIPSYFVDRCMFGDLKDDFQAILSIIKKY